jgi:phosphatidate cytidylyltransferase
VLRYRLLLGTILIAALAGLCWLDFTQGGGVPAGTWLLPLALLCCILATGELLQLLDAHVLPNWLIHIGCFAIVVSSAIGLIPAMGNWLKAAELESLGIVSCTFVGSAIAGFVWNIVNYQSAAAAAVKIALTIFCFFYIGLLLAFVVELRTFKENAQGMLALISLIAVVKMGDTGAYTIGRLVGRHKMAPRLSPGKTWEGAAGAMLFAVLGAWAVFNLIGPAISPRIAPLPFWRLLIFGLLVGTAGLFGDLAESLLKREAGRKDSSVWMPGFGGVLDVLDSILVAAPIAYFCWAGGLVR